MIWKENSAATISIWTTLAPETLRERKIRSGISGVRAVAWRSDEPGQQGERECAETERARRGPAVRLDLDDGVDARASDRR